MTRAPDSEVLSQKLGFSRRARSLESRGSDLPSEELYTACLTMLPGLRFSGRSGHLKGTYQDVYRTGAQQFIQHMDTVKSWMDLKFEVETVARRTEPLESKAQTIAYDFITSTLTAQVCSSLSVFTIGIVHPPVDATPTPEAVVNEVGGTAPSSLLLALVMAGSVVLIGSGGYYMRQGKKS